MKQAMKRMKGVTDKTIREKSARDVKKERNEEEEEYGNECCKHVEERRRKRDRKKEESRVGSLDRYNHYYLYSRGYFCYASAIQATEGQPGS